MIRNGSAMMNNKRAGADSTGSTCSRFAGLSLLLDFEIYRSCRSVATCNSPDRPRTSLKATLIDVYFLKGTNINKMQAA